MFNVLDLERPTLTVLAFLGTYLVTLAIGRLLRRRGGVRFGVLFQLFALTLAFYVAVSVHGGVIWRGHVGSALALLGTAVAVALIDRYVWDYYFEHRQQVVVPRLL